MAIKGRIVRVPKAPEAEAWLKKSTGLTLNILGYKEKKNRWVVLALEMDLRGYGNTYQRAIEDLADLVLMQISFALFKNQPEMILRPAEAIWFERFADARNAKLKTIALQRQPVSEYQIGGLPVPPPHIIAAHQTQFNRADA